MFHRFALLLAATFSVFGVVDSMAQVTVEPQAFAWFMTPDGDIDLGVDGISTSLSLGEIGADGSEVIPGGGIILGDRFQIGAEAYELSVDGQGRVERNVSLFGFNAGIQSDVASSIDLTMARAFARLNLEADGFQFGIEGGGQYADASASLQTDIAGTISAETEVIIPYLGGRIEARPTDWLVLRGSILYSSWDVSDVDTTFSQIDLSAHARLGVFTVGGGYRNLGIEIDAPEDNVLADLSFSGPIVFAGLMF